MMILKRGESNVVELPSLWRDGQGPLQFQGRQIASVEVAFWKGQRVTRLAIYLRRCHRYVAEFQRKATADLRINDLPVGFRTTYRAMAFDRLTDAVGFLWEGRPKEELRAQPRAPAHGVRQ